MNNMLMRYVNNPKWFKCLIILLLTCSLLPVAKGQSPALTINEVYQMSRKNYPLIKGIFCFERGKGLFAGIFG
jgi:hypothetical protein